MSTSKSQTVTEFVKTEFRDYSVENTRRMVPSVIDGLKRSQRKAVWAIAQMSGQDTVERIGLKAAAMTAYKHGGTNMCGTVVKMAQDFPGTNNFPLVQKDGQFGSLIDHDSSSFRYIDAYIHENYRKMFNEDDDDILEHQMDKGTKIEPYYLFPILPLAIVNGSRAVGSGYGTNFPGHNPKDVVRAILETLKHGKPVTKLVPYLEGYTGEILRLDTEQIEIRGKITIKNTTTFHISCVIPSKDKENYKNKTLIPALESGRIKDYIDDSNETDGWNITVKMTREALEGKTELDLLTEFDLIERNTPNYTVWDFDGSIKRYDRPEDIVTNFVAWRLDKNEVRRQSLLSKIQSSIDYWNQYANFLHDYLNNTDDYKKFDRKTMFEHVLKICCFNEVNTEKFIKTPAYRLNIDGIEKAKKKLIELQEEYTVISSYSARDIMYKDLERFV